MAVEARTRKSSEDRRKELIKATLEVIGEAYSLDVTVAEIAHCAGVSTALAHHYFGGKDDLFLAAMGSLLVSFRKDVLKRLHAGQTPRERLTAIVQASFAPSQFASETVAAWMIFYAKSGSSPRFARLLQIYVKRLRSNLLAELKRIEGVEAPPQAADAIGAMIDGLYLRQGLQTAPPDSAYCIAITEQLIDSLTQSRRLTSQSGA